MTEPLRTDPAAAPGASAAADQSARIEQLLLSGLDCYFAGQYDEAINIWTRVIFLERGHSRARAYIERARSAMAERQRESEELLHRGVAAYQSGDIPVARALLTQVLESEAPSDDALLYLQKLNRLEAAAVTSPRQGQLPATPSATATSHRAPQPYSWVMTALVAAAILGGVALGAAPLVSWIIELRGPDGGVALQPAAADAVPVVRTPDVLLARARALYAGGHLHDALRALDRIDIGDPVRPESDRLRGLIQRDLLAAAASGQPRDPQTGPADAGRYEPGQRR